MEPPKDSNFSVPLKDLSLTESNFNDLFSQLREAVLAKKPILKEILVRHGAKKLYDYARDYIDVNLNPPIQKRQDDFLAVIRKEVVRTLGDEVADSVIRQLSKHYFVSTADHLGPLTHAFFINSNLLMNAPYAESGSRELENVIVLACANVSLNNSSFPRGIVLHSLGKDGKTHYNGLSFSSAQYRLCPVYGFKAYNEADLKRMQDTIKLKVKEGEMSQPVATQLGDLIKDTYGNPEVLKCTTYADQVTKTNYDLWKKLMKSGGNTVKSNLVYLGIEKLVTDLILAYHLDQDTTVNHFLFDPNCYPMIHHYFQGITGTYSLLEQWGTYMFWALPKGSKYREQLWKVGNNLQTKDGSYSLPLTPEGVRKALESGQLIPSTMLIYTVLSFYYGLKCLGGFSQVNYLTYMKNAYIKMQVDRGMYKSIEVCARAQTKELVGDVNVAFLRLPDGELAPATGIDLLLYGQPNWWDCFVKQSKNISLDEAMNPMMPELYNIIYGEDTDPRFDPLTTREIARFTGLQKKIEPCALL